MGLVMTIAHPNARKAMRIIGLILLGLVVGALGRLFHTILAIPHLPARRCFMALVCASTASHPYAIGAFVGDFTADAT
jgi:hypothetical protein